MIKTLKIKIITNDFQHRALLSTMKMFNQVQNEISEMAFEAKEYRKYHVHKIVYHPIKQKYKEFSSQLIVRAIDNVTNTYKIKRQKTHNQFKKNGAVVYDLRILSFDEETISIWTMDGRLKNIPIIVHNKELFKYRKGQTDLKYENGKWFLLVTLDVPDQEKIKTLGCIGVDLGVVQVATTSDGHSYSGDQIKKKRKQYFEHRRRLQKRGTRSAKRRIKTIGRKESRFRKDVNHQISKKLVEKAKGTNCALVLEELKGINSRTTVRKSQRNERLSWSFYQLRSFIEYKAKENGVEVIIVPSPYTSQTCSKCGYCEKANRKNQSSFICQSCGFAANADINASINIKNLGDQSISLLLAAKAA
jgi:IS605 OrfB family transposase